MEEKEKESSVRIIATKYGWKCVQETDGLEFIVLGPKLIWTLNDGSRLHFKFEKNPNSKIDCRVELIMKER